MTTSEPISLVPLLYSPQQVRKYDQVSAVPANAMDGRLSFSILAFGRGSLGAAACVVACMSSMATTTAASVCVATLRHSSIWQGTFLLGLTVLYFRFFVFDDALVYPGSRATLLVNTLAVHSLY